MIRLPDWVRVGQSIVCIKVRDDFIPLPIVGAFYTIKEILPAIHEGRLFDFGITLHELPDFGDDEFDGPSTHFKGFPWDHFAPAVKTEEENKISEFA